MRAHGWELSDGWELNMMVARLRPTRPGESFEHAQNFSPGGYKRWHTVRTRYEEVR